MVVNLTGSLAHSLAEGSFFFLSIMTLPIYICFLWICPISIFVNVPRRKKQIVEATDSIRYLVVSEQGSGFVHTDLPSSQVTSRVCRFSGTPECGPGWFHGAPGDRGSTNGGET